MAYDIPEGEKQEDLLFYSWDRRSRVVMVHHVTVSIPPW